jgi:hypothetical protein
VQTVLPRLAGLLVRPGMVIARPMGGVDDRYELRRGDEIVATGISCASGRLRWGSGAKGSCARSSRFPVSGNSASNNERTEERGPVSSRDAGMTESNTAGYRFTR